MEKDRNRQMRHAALCSWPKYLSDNRAMEVLRLHEYLQLLGYDGRIANMSAEAIVHGWEKEAWIDFSPDGFRIRLTPKGNEQWATWREEDHLWRNGSGESMDLPKRLKAGEPANNLRRIRDVVGSRVISCIHDPYTDVRALENLLKLSELGVRIDVQLLLLGAPTKNATLMATLAKFLCDDINTQNKNQWAMRTYFTPERPHRRFLVCSDGSVITCGLSLNNLNKDETLDLIPASDERAKHDCQFFEEKWKSGNPI
jgi:hypothetical protein